MSGRWIMMCAGEYHPMKIDIRTGDFVVAVDGGLKYLLSAGIRPDFLLGDLDSMEAELAGIVEEYRQRGGSAFLQLPVETMVYNNQDKYYQAINRSTEANDSGIFIDFMLREILNALCRHVIAQKNADDPTEAIFRYIKDNPGVRAGMLAEKLSISRRTAERHLQALKKAERIEFRGAPRNGGYYPK